MKTDNATFQSLSNDMRDIWCLAETCFDSSNEPKQHKQETVKVIANALGSKHKQATKIAQAVFRCCNHDNGRKVLKETFDTFWWQQCENMDFFKELSTVHLTVRFFV